MIELIYGQFIDLPHPLAWTALLVLGGLAGGFLAGLFGVGGGIILVPVLYTLIQVLGFDSGASMKVAVATSLLTIIFTSIRSTRAHFLRDAVDMDLLKNWWLPIFIGVCVGTWSASWLRGDALTLIFATIALLVAANLFFRRAIVADGFPNSLAKFVSGMVVGGFSAMMGIGGGTLSVPILSAFNYDIRKAVGTASAIGFLIAVPATIGYAIAGWSVAGLPPFSLGYVNIFAAALVIPLSMITVPLGARVAHSIERSRLQLAFAIFLAITSAKMFADVLFR